MRARLFLLGFLMATPAFADEPATLLMPSPLLSAIMQYLATKPYSEVSAMIGGLQQCAAVQTPNQGALISHGECPAVTASLIAARKQQGQAGLPAPAIVATPTPAQP